MRLMLYWLVLVVLLDTAAVSLIYADTSYTGAVIRDKNPSIAAPTVITPPESKLKRTPFLPRLPK